MSKKVKTAILLLLLCVIIAIVPLLLIKDSEFGGADGEAEGVIAEIVGSEYEPWTNPLYEPPGGETESLLFCLQAALGAGVFGYGIGILKERKRRRVG